MKANPPTGSRPDPLLPLAELPGVPEAVDAMRTSVDRVYGHRVMRRRSSEVSAEAALRAARASAALAGADWALEEVRRRSDFGADEQARTVGAALRVTAEAGRSLDIWRTSPPRRSPAAPPRPYWPARPRPSHCARPPLPGRRKPCECSAPHQP
jgi:hypothetical protein